MLLEGFVLIHAIMMQAKTDLRLLGGQETLLSETKISETFQDTINCFFNFVKKDDHVDSLKKLYLNAQKAGANAALTTYYLTLSGCGNTIPSTLAATVVLHTSILLRYEDDLVDRDRPSRTGNPASDIIVQNLALELSYFTLDRLSRFIKSEDASRLKVFYRTEIAKLQTAELKDASIRGQLIPFKEAFEILRLKTGGQGELIGGISSGAGFGWQHQARLKGCLSDLAIALTMLTSDLPDVIHDFSMGLPNIVVSLAYDLAKEEHRRWLTENFGRRSVKKLYFKKYDLMNILEKTGCFQQTLKIAKELILKTKEGLNSIPVIDRRAMSKVIEFVDKSFTSFRYSDTYNAWKY